MSAIHLVATGPIETRLAMNHLPSLSEIGAAADVRVRPHLAVVVVVVVSSVGSSHRTYSAVTCPILDDLPDSRY